MAVAPLALPAYLQNRPPAGGFGFSEDPGNDLMSPDSKWVIEPPDPPAVLVPSASRLVKTLIKLKGETVEFKTASPMLVEITVEISPATEQSDPYIRGLHENSNSEAVALVESKEEASPVESKSNQTDENKDENNFEKLQIWIQKLHDDLIIQSKNTKSFSQSIHKALDAMNMLKGKGSGPATLSNATCPQSGQASQASDGLQAAAASARQPCASATTQISAQQTCANPQQRSWQIPPAESQEGGTNTVSSNIPHGGEDENEPESEPDEDITKIIMKLMKKLKQTTMKVMMFKTKNLMG